MPSYLTRIAALNGVSATEFAQDMGLTLKKIINLEEDAVRALSECGGLTDIQTKELISWTGQNVGDFRMVFRNEIFVSRALRNPIIRGCPVCLREDAETDPSRPLAQMAIRGDWQLRELNVCVAHRHLLVPLWEYKQPTVRFEFSQRLTEILSDILEGRLEQPRVLLSPYDLWLTRRLETGADHTWLADKSLYAATTFCKLLGTEAQRLHFPAHAAVATSGHASGFDIARHGEARIRNTLNALAAQANGHNDEPNKAFGQIYVDLSQAHLNKDDFAPFRKILRDCIVDIWPVAAGENVLGLTQNERQLHSITSAAHESKIGTFLLEQFLIHAGAITPDDDRPASRRTFDARAYAGLLAEIPALVGPKQMRQQMGATRRQLASLAEDKVLRPRIDIATIKLPWRVSDGLALVAELQELASSIDPSDERWEGIQQAKSRSGLRVGFIIAAIRAQQLQIGRREDLGGYAGFSVLKSEIDELKSPKIDQSVTPMVSAAVFGRSVGMRSKGWFEKLYATGHTPATCMPHPKLGGMHVYLSEGDVAEFHNRFFTSSTMEEEFGQHKRTLLAKLRAANVRAFTPNDQDFGALYLREEVEAILKTASNRPEI